MTQIVALSGLAVAALGAVGAIRPATLLDWARHFWQTPRGLAGVAALRLGLGAVLWVAAPRCRQPDVVQVLAVLSMVSGASVPLIGLRRAAAFGEWWASQGPGFVRGWSLFAIAFGVYLVWVST